MKHFFSKIASYSAPALFLLVLGVLLCNAVVFLFAYDKIVPEAGELESAQTAIILGAGVYDNGELTPMLKDRVDTAIAIYRDGIVEKILMSGDNGSVRYNEVVPVREYLLSFGIPSEDIFLDYAGFDTYDTMYRARSVFGVESAVVVTQSFHLPRSVFLAHSVGITVQGIAPETNRGSIYNHVREALARVKAVLDVLFMSEPAYLGEHIPITGNGEASVGE